MGLGINYTAWPEMLAWPYLILNGFLPYKDIAIAHNLLLLLDLTIFYKIFGVGMMQLKIYTWILASINIFLVYFVSSRFHSKKIGYLSSILFLLLTIIFEGNALWFEVGLIPFAILLYYFLNSKQNSVSNKNYLWVGVIFALGFLTKQTFVYFSLPIIYILFTQRNNFLNIFKNIALGALLVIVPYLTTLYIFGILDDYYKWAIEFGIFYLPNAIGQIKLTSLNQFIFATVPFVTLVFTKEILLTLFAIAGAIGVYPRWELFHILPALPFVSIATSLFFTNKKVKNIFKYLVALLLITFVVVGIKRQIGTTTRFYEPEFKNLVETINNDNSLKEKTLYVINYWDNLYPLTNTLPPKPLIPYIPWYLEYENNIDLIVNNLKSRPPEIIVIGKRENDNKNLYDFVDKYYTCELQEKSIELCSRN